MTGLVEKIPDKIPSTKKELEKRIEGIKEAAMMANLMRFHAAKLVKIGVTTDEINDKVHRICIEEGFYPAALDYKNFPKSISTSVNEVACHGIPDKRPLENGDVISIDCISYLNGYYGDCCGSYIVGKPSTENLTLVSVTRKCVDEAIKICGPGVPFTEIGRVIEKIAKSENLKVIKDFAGHGIGKNLHSPPFILHYENTVNSRVMEPGMTFTIEPILTTGNGEVETWPDKWTIITKDGKNCAMVEDTILINDEGAQNITEDI